MRVIPPFTQPVVLLKNNHASNVRNQQAQFAGVGDQVRFSGKHHREDAGNAESPPLKAARLDGPDESNLKQVNGQGMNGLMTAAQRGDVQALEAMLTGNPDARDRINQTDFLGKTALHHAVESGKLPVVALLLQHQATRNIADQDHHTPVTQAARRGDTQMLRMLCQTPEDVNPVPVSIFSRFPLTEAVREDQEEAVAFLLKQGASVDSDLERFSSFNRYDGRTSTPLMMAAINNNPRIMNLLLEHGAELELEDEGEQTALAHAAALSRWESVRYLLGKDANKGKAREALQDMLAKAAENRQVEPLRFLLRQGIKPALRTSRDQRAFYVVLQNAVSGNDLETARLLLNSGVRPDPDDIDETPALFLAAQNRHGRMAKLLLAHGANVDEQVMDKGALKGQTALHAAVRNNDEDLTRYLLNHEADREIADEEGRTAFTQAVESGHNDLAKKLHQEFGARIEWNFKRAKVNITPLMAAALSGNGEMIDFMLNDGADPNKPNLEGMTPLMWAKDRATALKLIQGGADVNDMDYSERTPLMYQSEANNTDVMDFLIQRGALLEDEDEAGQTALMLAASGHHVEAVNLLLNRGANVNHTDDRGDTALINAVLSKSDIAPPSSETERVQVINTLLDRGARINAFNDEHENALMIAAANQLPDSVETLLRRGGSMMPNRDGFPTALNLLVKALSDDAKSGGITTDGLKTLKLLIEADPGQAHDNGGLRLLFKEHIKRANQEQSGDNSSDSSPETQPRRTSYYQDVKRLILAGVPPQMGKPEIYGLLNEAAKRNDDKELEFFLKRGVDPDGMYRPRHTALMSASNSGSTRATDVLLEYGANPNQYNHLGENPFNLATKQGSMNTMLRLLQAGADPAPHLQLRDDDTVVEKALSWQTDDGTKTQLFPFSRWTVSFPPANQREIRTAWPVKLSHPEVADYVQSILGTNHPEQKVTWNLQVRNRQEKQLQEEADRRCGR